MNQSDIEEIAKEILESLNHPKNAEHREDFINLLKGRPQDLNDLLFGIVNRYAMIKVLSQPEAGVVSVDGPRVCAAITKRLLEMIGEKSTA
jgi:hypothetical protein